MRFWTAYQEPLRQAALVDDGRVIRTIPDHPPGTPTRWIFAVGSFDGKLLVGRRCDIQLWDKEGLTIEKSVYHPWIYALHSIEQFGDLLLAACAVLDVVFLFDWNGNARWSWHAYRSGYGPKRDCVDGKDWQRVQFSGVVDCAGSPHVNSANMDADGIVVTMLRVGKVVLLNTDGRGLKELSVPQTGGMHDFKYDRRSGAPVLVGGAEDGLVIGDSLFSLDGCQTGHGDHWYVKRVKLYEDDKYVVSHETGVAIMDRKGRVLRNFPLPRPFNAVVL